MDLDALPARSLLTHQELASILKLSPASSRAGPSADPATASSALATSAGSSTAWRMSASGSIARVPRRSRGTRYTGVCLSSFGQSDRRQGGKRCEPQVDQGCEAHNAWPKLRGAFIR